MVKGKRVAPYKQKGRKGKKKVDATELEMEQAGVDVEKIKNRLELMTAEEISNTQQVAAQNALKLFNEMLEEVKSRLPKMKDEVIVTTLLSIWDKTGGKK